MAECVNYNCAELPAYDSTIANCGSKVRLSGAATLYLIECGVDIPEDPGDQAAIDALVAAGDATAIENVKLGFGEPSAVTQDPITSCGPPQVVNYNRTATIEDYKVTTGNSDFWNAAKRRSFAGAILIECETDGLDPQVTVIDAELSVAAYRDFPNSNEQAQKYVITLSWKDIDDPLPYAYTP